jgi:hypothetical protein
VLVAVGAGDALVGAGAGVVAGGDKVVRAMVGEGAAEGTPDDAVGCVAGAVLGTGACGDPVEGLEAGDEPDSPAGWVEVLVDPPLPCGFAWPAAAPEGTGLAFVAAGVAAGTSWLVDWAGAARANTVAKPTVASALSWVARQVSRPSLRRPAVRAASGESS